MFLLTAPSAFLGPPCDFHSVWLDPVQGVAALAPVPWKPDAKSTRASCLSREAAHVSHVLGSCQSVTEGLMAAVRNLLSQACHALMLLANWSGVWGR